MPLVDPDEVQKMHEALTQKQRQILRDERCLSDEIIDRYKLGVTRRGGDPMVTIPIANNDGDYDDVRCWRHPDRRRDRSKIEHWKTGYGGARLFPIDMLQHNALIIVAGELDALALISHGVKAITITAGESAWPDEISVQIADAGVKWMTVLPDNDDVGQRAAERRAQSLAAHGLRARVARWP